MVDQRLDTVHQEDVQRVARMTRILREECRRIDDPDLGAQCLAVAQEFEAEMDDVLRGEDARRRMDSIREERDRDLEDITDIDVIRS